MIKPLDIEKLNRVAPYQVEETDDVGFINYQGIYRDNSVIKPKACIENNF